MLGQWELENMDRRVRRHPDEARSKFEEWVIRMGGSGVVSKLVGVHQVTVCSWLRRRSVPNTASILKLVSLSEGFITMQDIVDGTKT